MVRVAPPSRSFASGEISRLLDARVDFDRHANGLRFCRGFISLPEGPVTRCPGTEFIGELPETSVSRLMAFVFSDNDAVLLEWTNRLLRFWRNGNLVMKDGEPYTIRPVYGVRGVPALQSLQSSDRIYLTDGVHAPQRLSRFAIDDWTLEPTPFTNGPFRPQNIDRANRMNLAFLPTTVQDAIISVTTDLDTFTASHVGSEFLISEVDNDLYPLWSPDLPAQRFQAYRYQNNVYIIDDFDFSDIVTGSVAPTVNGSGEIERVDAVNWIVTSTGNPDSVKSWEKGETIAVGDRRYIDDYTIEVSSLVATRTTGANPPVHSDGTVLSNRGGPYWSHFQDNFGTLEITSVTSARTAFALPRSIPSSLYSTPSYRWSEAAWSDLHGYPRAIGSFQQRHIYGGTTTDPRGIWSSVIGGTTDMTADGDDDDGFSYILSAPTNKAGEILWIVGASSVVHIGTSADELYGSGTDADRAFGESTAKFGSDTSHGSYPTPPVVINGMPLFVHKNSRRLMAVGMTPEGRAFQAENLTQIARHILGDGVSRIVYQEEPVPIVWAVGTDGDLIGMTYVPAQQVIAFHRHKLAGGQLKDIEVMPSDDGLTEDLFLTVARTIQGDEKLYLERMHHPFIELDGSDLDITDAWFQFSAKRYKGAATTQMTGLDHLNGQSVVANTSAGVVKDLIVSNGSVTFPQPVTSAIVGLDGTADQFCETLDIMAGAPDGGDAGRLRTHRVSGVQVHETAACNVQIVQRNSGVERRTPSQPLFNLKAFEQPELRNGIFEIGGHKGWSHQMGIRLSPDVGLPLTLMALTPTIMVTDS